MGQMMICAGVTEASWQVRPARSVRKVTLTGDDFEPDMRMIATSRAGVSSYRNRS